MNKKRKGLSSIDLFFPHVIIVLFTVTIAFLFFWKILFQIMLKIPYLKILYQKLLLLCLSNLNSGKQDLSLNRILI